ncbi:MAG TPA: DUF4097 family beta strand repeat-containing protein [Longimicrobiaceae bacterium]|nr:DUF4097 family beta strand repeat-containing protein [Longimicrobiaceae bacterium]
MPSPSRAALTALAFVSLLAAFPAAAQQSDQEWLQNCREQAERRSRDRALFCEVRTASMRPTGSLRVDAGVNGGVTVRGGDAAEIQVSSRVQASAPTEQEARELARQLSVRVENGTVIATGPETSRGSWWSVSHDIRAPRRQDVSVTARNGGVTVHDVSGRMTLRTSNGGLSLRRVGGAVNARTTNGGVNVELEGSRWNGEGLDAESTNGGVSVTIPDGYSAQLEVGAVNGRMDLDLPLPDGYRSGRTVRTQLGSGGAPVRVVTTNGGVRVRRSDR